MGIITEYSLKIVSLSIDSSPSYSFEEKTASLDNVNFHMNDESHSIKQEANNYGSPAHFGDSTHQFDVTEMILRGRESSFMPSTNHAVNMVSL